MKILNIKKTNPCRNCLVLACCRTRCQIREEYIFFKDKVLIILVGIPLGVICIFVSYMCYIHGYIKVYAISHIASSILLVITLLITKELDKGDFSGLFDNVGEFVFSLSIITIIGPWLLLMHCFQLCWNKINGPQPKIFGRRKPSVRI